MYTKEDIEMMEKRKLEIDEEIARARDERKAIMKVLNSVKAYEKAYGNVDREKRGPRTEEELRTYNREKMREWRAKRKKELQEAVSEDK